VAFVSRIIVVGAVIILLYQSECFSQEPETKAPESVVYFGVVYPLVTFDKNQTTFNSNSGFTIGFPFGVNLKRTEKMYFSMEMVPFIKNQNGESRVDRLLIHPGLLFRLRNGYSFTMRLAFETTGRYGFTPVVAKIILRKPGYRLYLSANSSVRFGNQSLPSVGIGVQVGVLL
jgi:hypothetical protein